MPTLRRIAVNAADHHTQHPAAGRKRKLLAAHSEVEYSVPVKKHNDLVTEGGDHGGNQGSSTQFVVHGNYNHHDGGGKRQRQEQ